MADDGPRRSYGAWWPEATAISCSGRLPTSP